MICENCGSQVDERVGVCPFCGVVQKNAARWKQKVFVTPDHCCLCGQPLAEGYRVLFAYESGDEARIDFPCAQALEALRNPQDPAAVAQSLHRFGAPLESGALDPAVADQLRPLTESARAWLSRQTAATGPLQPQPAPQAIRERPAPPQEDAEPAGRNLKMILIIAAILAGIALLVIGILSLNRGRDSGTGTTAAPAASSPAAAVTQAPAASHTPAATPTPSPQPSAEPLPTAPEGGQNDIPWAEGEDAGGQGEPMPWDPYGEEDGEGGYG